MAENHNGAVPPSERNVELEMQVAFGKYMDGILGPWERQMLTFVKEAKSPGDRALRIQALIQCTAFIAEKARYMGADVFPSHQVTQMVAAGMANLAERTTSALTRKTGIINH